MAGLWCAGICLDNVVFAAAMVGTVVEAEDSLLQKAFSKLDVDCDGEAW